MVTLLAWIAQEVDDFKETTKHACMAFCSTMRAENWNKKLDKPSCCPSSWISLWKGLWNIRKLELFLVPLDIQQGKSPRPECVTPPCSLTIPLQGQYLLTGILKTFMTVAACLWKLGQLPLEELYTDCNSLHGEGSHRSPCILAPTLRGSAGGVHLHSWLSMASFSLTIMFAQHDLSRGNGYGAHGKQPSLFISSEPVHSAGYRYLLLIGYCILFDCQPCYRSTVSEKKQC